MTTEIISLEKILDDHPPLPHIHWNDEINTQGSSVNQKTNSTMSAMVYTGVIFVRKKSCLVALFTFRILEP